MVPLNTFVNPRFDCMSCGSRLKFCIVCIIAQIFSLGFLLVLSSVSLLSVSFSDGKYTCFNRCLWAVILNLRKRDVFCRHAFVGLAIAAFISLLMHISCTSSSATE